MHKKKKREGKEMGAHIDTKKIGMFYLWIVRGIEANVTSALRYAAEEIAYWPRVIIHFTFLRSLLRVTIRAWQIMLA